MRTNISLFSALCSRLDAVDAWMADSTSEWIASPARDALARAVRVTYAELAYADRSVQIERTRQLRAVMLSRPVEERHESLCNLVGQGRIAVSVVARRYREIMA